MADAHRCETFKKETEVLVPEPSHRASSTSDQNIQKDQMGM
jgi:hypothetical protein